MTEEYGLEWIYAGILRRNGVPVRGEGYSAPLETQLCSATSRDADEDDWRADRALTQEINEKLNQLYAFFSIPQSTPDRWLKLAMALAFRHVPGLQLAPQRGRPKLSFDENWKLHRAVRTLMEQEGLTQSAACRRLAQEDPWRSQNLSAEALRRRFQQSKGTLDILWGGEKLIAEERAARQRD